MLKGLSDQLWVFLDLGQFLIHPCLHLLAGLSGPSLLALRLAWLRTSSSGFRSGA